MSWPSRITRSTMCGNCLAFRPSIKKVAVASYSRSKSSNRGVSVSLGPSSKVRTRVRSRVTSFRTAFIRLHRQTTGEKWATEPRSTREAATKDAVMSPTYRLTPEFTLLQNGRIHLAPRQCCQYACELLLDV